MFPGLWALGPVPWALGGEEASNAWAVGAVEDWLLWGADGALSRWDSTRQGPERVPHGQGSMHRESVGRPLFRCVVWPVSGLTRLMGRMVCGPG